MDIFTLKGIIKELNDDLKFSIINKIYHYENEFYFNLYGARDKKNLYINISPSNQIIAETEHKFNSPTIRPSSFCMILRKYLLNKKIKNFSLLGFYRILKIEVENYFLIVKFTGKSSDILLTDNELNIIYSFKEKNKTKKFEIPNVNFVKSVKDFENISKIEGLPPFAIKEIKYIKEKYGIEKAFNFYQKLINFEIPLKPIKIGNKIFPFPLEHINQKYDELTKFNEIYEPVLDLKKDILKKINEKIKKIEKAIEKVKFELEEKKKYEEYIKFGELLKANLHKLKSNVDEVEIFDYYENKTIKIKIDKTLTPIENMEKYFTIGKKYKRALDKLQERYEILNNELLYYKEILFFVENSENISVLKSINFDFEHKQANNIKEKSKPYIETTFMGKKIIIGKSAKGNEYIIKHFKNPNFVWCHAKGVPGAHVIILEEFEKISKEVIEYACKLALKNSKAKNDLKGDVIYTKLKYIKKSKNLFPGQVIVTKENVLNIKINDEI